MDTVETANHCLWSCDFAMEIWKRIITMLISVYPRAVYTWGRDSVLQPVAQDKPMVYEKEGANALAMRHGSMQKAFIPMNPQIEIDKLKIWQFVSSITFWYI